MMNNKVVFKKDTEFFKRIIFKNSSYAALTQLYQDLQAAGYSDMYVISITRIIAKVKSPDFYIFLDNDKLYQPSIDIKLLHRNTIFKNCSIVIYNEKMLQDKKIRELLLEYII